MLVLSRKIGESILIPGIDTKIVVLETNSGQVRLGIRAPKSIFVVREEIPIPQDQETLLQAVEATQHLRQQLIDSLAFIELLRKRIENGESQADLLVALDQMINNLSQWAPK